MKPITTPFTILTDRLRGRGSKSAWIEYMITITCGVGNMLFGYDQGVMGGFLTSPPFERTFPEITGSGNSTLQGFTVAVYEIGCALGAGAVIVAGDRMGRRMAVMLGQLIIIVGAILQASSFSLAQLIAARVVTGCGNGMSVAVLPTWNGECSRATNRGRSILWELNVNIFGISVAYWVDYGLTASSVTGNTDWAWRFPLALQCFFAVLTIALSLLLPDSPRALIRRGRMTEARDVIDMLSLQEDPATRTSETNYTISVIDETLREEAESNATWSDIFTQGKPRFRQRMILAILSLCMLQISGINLITYYAPVIFQNTLGMSRNTALLVSGFNGLEYWLATFIPIPMIDRIGRRPLLLFAAAGQAVSMAVLAAMIAYPESTACGYVAAVFLFLFNTFFAVGFCGIPFLLPVELTPLQTRSKSVGLATACFWLCNFFVVMISPVLISNIKYGTYILWTGTNLAFILMIYFLIPETSNAALEDIDVLFEITQKWNIGPGSKKLLAEIMASREERNTEGTYEEKAVKLDRVEDSTAIGGSD